MNSHRLRICWTITGKLALQMKSLQRQSKCQPLQVAPTNRYPDHADLLWSELLRCYCLYDRNVIIRTFKHRLCPFATVYHKIDTRKRIWFCKSWTECHLSNKHTNGLQPIYQVMMEEQVDLLKQEVQKQRKPYMVILGTTCNLPSFYLICNQLHCNVHAGSTNPYAGFRLCASIFTN